MCKSCCDTTNPKETKITIPNRDNTSPPMNEWKNHWNLVLSLFILVVMLILEYAFHVIPPSPLDLILFGIAYLLSGYNVLGLALNKVREFDFFNEFMLMSVATLGAFAIGSYSEGVAVMVFYSIGEWFQESAVNKAKSSIKSLLDVRPDTVTVIRQNQRLTVDPQTVQKGEIIEVKPGEKVALDGILVSPSAAFNTSALTGESKPDNKHKNESILAGMINIDKVSLIEVTTLFNDSKLSRILEMVQEATSRKSKTQLFISKFAKIYTPIIFILAVFVCFLPYFFAANYSFETWFYRSLVFLVISCPCALVVSIPLGYFGGIGLASRNGILLKGANYLDGLTKIDTVVMDKTGTLTKGVFKVQTIIAKDLPREALLQHIVAIERFSTHPIAKAIVEYSEEPVTLYAENVEEIAGLGLKGKVNSKEILVGNGRLLSTYEVDYPMEIKNIVDTVVLIAIDGLYAGYLTIADELKEDSKFAIEKMHQLGLQTIILSGDKQAVVNDVAFKLRIDEAYGDLLPDGKVAKVQELKQAGKNIAFIGDGVNDAPVLAMADVGIAMGGLGSDVAIETADVVIQNDQPSKLISAIETGRITNSIVWQNIILALSVKIIVLTLGAGGVASLWEAVIADVGVALLAILNAVRIQRLKLGN